MGAQPKKLHTDFSGYTDCTEDLEGRSHPSSVLGPDGFAFEEDGFGKPVRPEVGFSHNRTP